MRCDGLVAEVRDWAAGLEEVHARIAGAFARAEPRARVLAYLRGLLGQLERKNGWTLAEAAGEVSPDGMQRLLRTADWNADAVRGELRNDVVSGSARANRPAIRVRTSSSPAAQSRTSATRPSQRIQKRCYQPRPIPAATHPQVPLQY